MWRVFGVTGPLVAYNMNNCISGCILEYCLMFPHQGCRCYSYWWYHGCKIHNPWCLFEVYTIICGNYFVTSIFFNTKYTISGIIFYNWSLLSRVVSIGHSIVFVKAAVNMYQVFPTFEVRRNSAFYRVLSRRYSC